ncbi:MAG: amino acid permease [Acidobacteria bacterium]|nr:MAG: amino acid permease [Acidobacteriota bacterium]
MKARLFKIKSPDTFINDAQVPERRMKRSLTSLDLTALGIGAIIGAGIFALTGTAAAGQSFQSPIETPVINFISAWLSGSPLQLGRAGAGPAIVLSFLVAAVACAFAALCYAEMASMIPVSGSAYTYSYATLGEFIAWVIGWDLILEYAVGNIAVAVSWSDFFTKLLYNLTHLKLPLWLVKDYGTAHVWVEKAQRLALFQQAQLQLSPIEVADYTQAASNLGNYSSSYLPSLLGHELAFNLPAFLIVALLTVLLVIGIQESARFNTAAVLLKTTIVVFFIAFGAYYINPAANWHPFMPNGFTGVMGGAAIVFFAFIGFDAVSTTAEETRNPQRDLPIAMISSLIICTLLYVGVSGVLTGMKKYTAFVDDAAAIATAVEVSGKPWVQALVSAGALAGMTSVILVFQLGQPRIFMAMARDGLLPQYFARLHPRFRTPYITTIWTGAFVGFMALVIDIGSAAELTNIGTLFAFILVSAGVIVLRRTAPLRPRPFKTPWVPLLPLCGILSCFALMLSLPVLTWIRFIVWLGIGLILYALYGYKHSDLAKDEERVTSKA